MAVEVIEIKKRVSCNAEDLAITILRLQVSGYVVVSVESKFFIERYYEIIYGKVAK